MFRDGIESADAIFKERVVFATTEQQTTRSVGSFATTKCCCTETCCAASDPAPKPALDVTLKDA